MTESFQNFLNINKTTNYVSENIKNVTDINTKLFEDDGGDYLFILIPLAVLFGVLALSALVFYMAHNRRRYAHIYNKRKISRRHWAESNDDDSDDVALLQNDDFGNATEHLLQGELHIDNSYETYEATYVNGMKQ